MDPRDFHTQARALAAAADEASQRSAVSRAYCAALNYAALAVERMGVQVPEDATIHDVIADAMVDVGPGLKHQLETLRYERGRADYRVWEPWDGDATDAVDVADHIIATITQRFQL